MLLLMVLAIYAVLFVVCLVTSWITGFPVNRLMKMPSFAAISREPKLAAASHRAWLITFLILFPLFTWFLLKSGGY